MATTRVTWGFTCSCSICRQPESHIRASDIRLDLIRNLKDQLNDWSVDNPDRVRMGLTLVELCKMERLYVGITSAYEATAYAYSVAGDRWGAMEYAGKAVEALTIFYGPEHNLTRDLEVMMVEPEKHRTWLWKATKKANRDRSESLYK
jgi:hypothetical protein